MILASRVRQLIGAMICVAALSLPPVVVVAADESTPEKIETCDNPEPIPLVSIEELEK
jgi:hypothetical protein